ncbi:hypothetical protein EL26_16345 [Tumebacillus flagellatus]|uniref:Glycine zipper domain-containing protein n=2 Tax=Tumebacillus flagellatus TaxID=1157490 RepID=A0A074LNZ9_9BACL|nr:hypothetical protein EL26_16345 [Tumebacillus flagellatus]
MFRGGSLWAGIISGGMQQLQHTKALQNGAMDRKTYAVHTTGNVSSALGTMAGIEYGAMLGSAVMPGIGTIAGSIVGGIVGDRVGRYVGHNTGRMMFNTANQVVDTVNDQILH